MVKVFWLLYIISNVCLKVLFTQGDPELATSTAQPETSSNSQVCRTTASSFKVNTVHLSTNIVSNMSEVHYS